MRDAKSTLWRKPRGRVRVADPPRVRTGNFPFGGNSSLYPTFFIASQENFVNAEFILPETARARSRFSGAFVFHWQSLPSSIDPQPVPVFHAQMTSIQHDTSATSVPPQPRPPAQPNFTHWHLFRISLLALGDSGYYFSAPIFRWSCHCSFGNSAPTESLPTRHRSDSAPLPRPACWPMPWVNLCVVAGRSFRRSQ